MTIDEANALKIGDPVICTVAGLSGVRYFEGDVGTVRLKQGAFFGVTLSDGRETGITAPGSWEYWGYDIRTAQGADQQVGDAHPYHSAQT